MVFSTIIHRNSKLSEAPSFGVSVIMHDATCKGAINYLNLAREIIRNGSTGRRANDLGQPAWASFFAPLRAEANAMKPGLASVIEGDLAYLAAAWPRDLPQGVVHADYFPDNVFFLGERFAAAMTTRQGEAS